MRGAGILFAACGLGLASVPAQAAVTFNFSGGCTSNCGLDGPDGNARIFSGLDGSLPVSVRVTAWSLHSGNVLRTAFLGHYSGGLGVTSSTLGTSNDGSGGDNLHTVDNKGSLDFILFQFSERVLPDRATLTAFQLSGTSYTDADGRIYVTDTTTDWDDPYNAATLQAQMAAIDAGGFYAENTTGTTPNFNNGATQYTGDVFIFSARPMPNDGKYDAFKLSSFTVNVVPEPSTWAMMITGFGAVGSALRRRRRRLPASLALAS